MRDTTTKRQIIKDPAETGTMDDAAFPGVDDGAPPGDPLAAADGGVKPARKIVVFQIRKTSQVRI